MGFFSKLFGGSRAKPAPPAAEEEDFDADALIEELKAEGAQARAGDVDVQSSPKQVCRYVFVQLMAGTPTARLREDLTGRGFPVKVADAYITLIESTLFGGGRSQS
jgi:hypothetical protein